MAKKKIIILSKELSQGPCYNVCYNSEFENDPTCNVNEFLCKIQHERYDLSIICFCSARVEHIEELLHLVALSGLVPVVICLKSFNPGFIRIAVKHGVDRFILCDMTVEKISDVIHESIHSSGLKEYFLTRYTDSYASNYYIHKLIDEIIYTFPRRLSVIECANRLGISRSWLQKLCLQVFDRSLKSLMRNIRIYYALRMMKETNMDNTEIAIYLNYSEESNLARDFRKELGCSPNDARSRLAKQSIYKLLL